MVMKAFSFCFSGISLSLLQFWMITLIVRVLLVVSFFLSVLWLYHSNYFWPVKFLLKNQLLALWGYFLCITSCFSVAAFKILSLTLILDNFIIICLGEDHFELKLFVNLCASWTRMSNLSPDLGSSQSLFLKISFLPLSPSLLLLWL